MGNMATENVASARIASLLDAGSFVEIGGAVTARSTDFNMQEKDTPADGVITGYGVIDGNLVYVYSQDATVLNGAIGEMHAKKISNIYDMAMKMGAPVIGLVDCAGFRLQEATDALEAFGNLYLKQSMASGVIPQITAIFGTCGGGLPPAHAGRAAHGQPGTGDGRDLAWSEASRQGAARAGDLLCAAVPWTGKPSGQATDAVGPP